MFRRSLQRLFHERRSLWGNINQVAEVQQNHYQPLLDTFGRRHDYLRISVIERCNLRCTYCMPEEGVQLTPNDRILTTGDIFRLANLFVTRFGVRKIRLTGGEPLVRKDIVNVVERLAELKQLSGGLETIGMTTNGIVFERHCSHLKKVGLDSVNISLDTLDEARFEVMTRRRGLRQVLRSIEAALSESFESVKINCVPIKGINDHEVVDFVELTRNAQLEVRFIEYMPFDGNRWQVAKMVSFDELLLRICDRFPSLRRLPPKSPNETSVVYQVNGFRGTIGFIASMTNPFCGGCNRIRLTADGHLKVCLFGNEEISLKEVISLGRSDEQIAGMIVDAVAKKAKQHAGATTIAKNSNRPMILIAARNYSTDSNLSHIDPTSGRARMVNIGLKSITSRKATARAHVHVGGHVVKLINTNQVTKGDVLTVAKIAGIQAAKSTSSLIPLCHQIAIDSIDLSFTLTDKEVIIECTVLATDKTGVEMEALTGVSVAALTIYDMCKAANKAIAIVNIQLLSKSGGRSGEYQSSE